MASNTATTAEPVVHIEDAGPCRKKLTVELSSEIVTAELEQAYGAVATQAQIPGFRRGKAPRRLIERMFGKAAQEEARNRLVSAAYSRAVDEQKLRVVGDPEGGEELANLELESGKPARFTLEVEVAPEFDLPSVENIPVKKPLYEATDEMIDDEIDRIALNEGDLEPRERAEAGDYCSGHGVIKTADGKVAVDIEGAVIKIPTADEGSRGSILGVIVDDFAEQVGSPAPGDTITVKATGPEQHESPVVRGKPITIEFEVQRVDRIVPASREQLRARFGMTSDDQLREAVGLRINQNLMIRQQSVLRQQIADYLLDNVEMELPSRLSERQAERSVQRRRMELLYRGFNPVQVEEQLAELRAASAETSQRELKLFFVLDKAAAELDVQVTEPDVNGRIAQIAQQRGERPDKLRAELIRTNQVGAVVQQIREHKTMDALLAKAKVEEVSAAEFGAESGEKQKKPATKKKTSSKKSS